MNLIQIIKKARLGVDAVLPGGNVSSQWQDEEMVDLTNTAYDEVWRRFRLARKKWGLLTLRQTDAAFTRDGEPYNPAVELQITPTKPQVKLPPDFGELVRILPLLSNPPEHGRGIRFFPDEIESAAWIDEETNSWGPGYQTWGSFDYYSIAYDIVASRTVIFVPPGGGPLIPPAFFPNVNLQIDYIPLKRPLYYSGMGTVEQVGTALTGTGTTWVDDNLSAENVGSLAELITLNDPFSSIGEVHDSIRLDRDYPRVTAITANTTATMAASATVAAGTPYILAMAPALPRDTHRWLSEYVSALMLKKINPELAQKYGEDVLKRFEESIRPTVGQRQSQESPITEGVMEFNW